MKDSGIAWIGQVPAHWITKKIKYIVTLRTEKRKLSDYGIYIGLENVEKSNARFVESDTEYPDGYYDWCDSGDLLYSKLRPNLEKVLIAPFAACCTGEFAIISMSLIDKRYLKYFFLSSGFTECVVSSTYGAKMPRANWGHIENLAVVYPANADEITVICECLDTRCAEIDGIIAGKKQQLETLEAYKKALIYEYVTGKKEVPAI